jgi:hypothetical protein
LIAKSQLNLRSEKFDDDDDDDGGGGDDDDDDEDDDDDDDDDGDDDDDDGGGSMGMGEVTFIGVDSALVLTHPGVQ